jgi:hypothetical protein
MPIDLALRSSPTRRVSGAECRIRVTVDPYGEFAKIGWVADRFI